MKEDCYAYDRRQEALTAEKELGGLMGLWGGSHPVDIEKA